MIQRRYLWLAFLSAAIQICGCHSACFQTAEIRNGVDAALGVTRVEGAEEADVSDYSVFVRGEVGRAARPERFGYSFGLTFISPFESQGRRIMDGGGKESGDFPNERPGVLPEFRLQAPRRLPVDLTLDLRLMTVAPERLGIIASRKVVGALTAYGSYFVNVDIGQLAVGGCEVRLTDTASLLAEYSMWLSDHDYPTDYRGGRRTRPYSLGLAISYHLPRKQEPYDSRPYAQKGDSTPFSYNTYEEGIWRTEHDVPFFQTGVPHEIQGEK
jgi:hypothetical protein